MFHVKQKRDLREIMTRLEKWAQAAGEIQREYFGKKDLRVETKTSEIDLVTEVDRKTESFLISSIREQYPDDSILSEEEGKKGKDSEYCWIIDPLDGTTNYVFGIPLFAVSVALQRKSKIIAGAVHVPLLNQTFLTGENTGAFLNGEKIKIRKPVKKLREALVFTGFPYSKGSDPDNNADYTSALCQEVKGFRRLGAAAYDLACVAQGSCHAYWELKVKKWDIAAGILLVKEAGGEVFVIREEEETEFSLIAGHPETCELIWNRLYQIRKDTIFQKISLL